MVLSHAALCTEANVVMPATLLGHRRDVVVSRVLRFWGWRCWATSPVRSSLAGSRRRCRTTRLTSPRSSQSSWTASWRFFERSTAAARVVAVGSGMLANWLVGMAAFFAVMGRTIIGKYIPVLLAVTLFVAANFQHSPANMGFFALADLAGGHPGWLEVLAWSIVPAGVGNLLGGSLLVALPLWYALRHDAPPGRVS